MTEAHKTGDDLRRASRGESRGDPAQSPVPLLVFPRIKLDPYLLLASGRVNVGERMGWRAQGREKQRWWRVGSGRRRERRSTQE